LDSTNQRIWTVALDKQRSSSSDRTYSTLPDNNLVRNIIIWKYYKHHMNWHFQYPK
jgi:hypothetical protein